MWFKFILFYCIVQYILELINNLRRQFKTNKYLICICISEVDYSRILLNLISNFFQIYMGEYEKQVQTLESVHPLISKHRQAG